MTHDLQSAPSVADLRAHLDPRLLEIAERIHSEGGRAYLVGGWPRDWLRGEPSKDVDVEVHGLELDRLEKVLEEFGSVRQAGRSFGVLIAKGLDVDFSLPRRDSKSGPGHRGIRVEVDPGLDPREASRRRDLTINTMMIDLRTAELLDLHGGREDLAAGRLRATDPASFGEDPLRALRVVQFAARFEMKPDEELHALCAQQNLDELSAERVFGEFRKLLLRARRPSVGLQLLRSTGLLGHFPALADLVGVAQDPRWHPEGDVWTHTCMVVDEAAALRHDDEDDLTLMFAALCHDLGKPSTTSHDPDGHVRSPRHDVAGVPLARRLLEAMRAPQDLIRSVEVLTQHHLAPMQYVQNGAGEKAYRRLARRLQRGGTNVEMLARVATADHFGRTTEDALAREFPAGDEFLARARALDVAESAVADVVKGRHLLSRGYQPGPEVGEILERCRDLQDKTGWTDPEKILTQILGPFPSGS